MLWIPPSYIINDVSIASESVPGDEVYERAVNLATTVYQLEGDKDSAQFVPIHEGITKMITVALLQTKSVSLNTTPSPSSEILPSPFMYVDSLIGLLL